jgi:hypothetical protein
LSAPLLTLFLPGEKCQYVYLPLFTIILTNVSDPDPSAFVLIWLPWIWIRTENVDYESGFRKVKMASKKVKDQEIAGLKDHLPLEGQKFFL